MGERGCIERVVLVVDVLDVLVKGAGGPTSESWIADALRGNFCLLVDV